MPSPPAQPAAVEPTPEDFKRAHELIWDPKFKYVLENADPYSDVEALIAGALAEARQETAPQPIDTAPKDKAIMVYSHGWRIAHFNTAYDLWIGNDVNSSDTRALKQFPPMHWRHLPDPPAAAIRARQGKEDD